jgi:hypothetical protein
MKNVEGNRIGLVYGNQALIITIIRSVGAGEKYFPSHDARDGIPWHHHK